MEVVFSVSTFVFHATQARVRCESSLAQHDHIRTGGFPTDLPDRQSAAQSEHGEKQHEHQHGHQVSRQGTAPRQGDDLTARV